MPSGLTPAIVELGGIANPLNGEGLVVAARSTDEV
jgi:hypothetical protein